MSKIEKFLYNLFPFLILVPFFFFLRRYLNIDFWYDEVFTLTNYVFCPIKKTLTDYSFPNNHILANLINNIYLKVLGIKDIYQLLETPYKIRLLELFYTGITLFYLHRIGKRFFNQTVAFLSLAIFATTITYYNFALQVRGFSLSIMLLTILLYHLLNFWQTNKPSSALFILLAAALLLYTIPSNFYYLLAIGGYFSLSLFWWRKRPKVSKEERKRRDRESAPSLEIKAGFKTRILILIFLILGVCGAIILYSPVLKDVVSNRFVQSRGLFYFPTLFQALPLTFAHFLSGRYLFIPIIILGLFLYYQRKKKKYLGFFLFLFLSPFVFSFLRGDRPYLRIFVPLTSVFALFLSLLMESVLDHFLKNTHLKFKPFLLVLGLVIYNYLTFAFQIRHIAGKIASDISEGIQSQDLNYNYYQFHYQPFYLLSDFKKRYEREPLPVFLGEYDRAALPVYLEKFGIPWQALTSQQEFLSLIEERGGFYLITAFPNRFLRFFTNFPNLLGKRLNQNLDFHNILLISKR